MKIIIIVTLVIILSFVLLVVYNITKKQPSPTNINNNSAKADYAPMKYDDSKQKYLLEMLKKRPLLTDQDKVIRSTLEKGPVPLIKTDEYEISYISAADVFLSELYSKNIDLAKDKAVAWLKDKGLSNTGICNLPVVFYLNSKTADELKDSVTNFNPLPSYCKTSNPLAYLLIH